MDRKKDLSVLNDTPSDKPCAKKRELATSHRSRKHQRKVKGTDFQTLLCTDALIPCDFRVYDASSGSKPKNAHFVEMLKRAKERGFEPEYVLMDSWYSSKNLKLIARQGWLFLTRIKSNRLVNPDGKGKVPISSVDIAPEGRVVHLRGFGWVKVFQKVSGDGGLERWATDDLQMPEGKRADLERQGWGIEVYRWGLERCSGAEGVQVRRPLLS